MAYKQITLHKLDDAQKAQLSLDLEDFKGRIVKEDIENRWVEIAFETTTLCCQFLEKYGKAYNKTEQKIKELTSCRLWGSTYDVKDELKKKFNARWDGENWIVHYTHYEAAQKLVDDEEKKRKEWAGE